MVGECNFSDWLRPNLSMWVNSSQRTLLPKVNVGTVFTRSRIHGCWWVNTGESPLHPMSMPVNGASNFLTWQHDCQGQKYWYFQCTPYTFLSPTSLSHHTHTYFDWKLIRGGSETFHCLMCRPNLRSMTGERPCHTLKMGEKGLQIYQSTGYHQLICALEVWRAFLKESERDVRRCNTTCKGSPVY